ncbi:HicA family toxin-antitoxin system [Virgibacillus sp. W0181]|uniref:HicA family toxin-antitoxin system n=1 Tax=Virgibacillus sp. W0181 TaxID=3391581 RepID=UPI003F48570B
MVDNFEVDSKYKARPYERHEFKLVIDGKYYKGDYHGGEIHWLNPHPKQVVSKSELRALEHEVYELLGEHGVRDDTDNIEIESLENNQSRKMHMFKLKIQGEEFKGTFRHGYIEWFHPKPVLKLKGDRVEKIEAKVKEKMNEKFAE